jgi:signal-transduction protein with cAMP-binding, CBS, and nucleotidyltransferase domain
MPKRGLTMKKRLTMKKKTISDRAQGNIENYVNTTLCLCYPDNTIRDAAKIMNKRHAGSVLIVDRKDKKQVLGIFTERDLVKKVILNRLLYTEKLGNVMTKKIVTADICSTDVYISHLMHMNKIKKVVITKEGMLYGVISQTDILRLLSEKCLGVIFKK